MAVPISKKVIYAALAGIGLIAAFAGIPELDGVASIVIGLILGVTAVLLAYESKGLLIGEGARPAALAGITDIVSKRSGIERVNEQLTMHLGPQDVLLTLSLDFDDRLTAGQVETAITELETATKASCPEVTRVFIEAQS